MLVANADGVVDFADLELEGVGVALEEQVVEGDRGTYIHTEHP